MNTYLIVIQIPDANRRETMINHIKENSSWARLTENAWCVKNNVKTTAEIRDGLTNKMPLQSTERLIVVNMTKSAWASYNLPKEVADWLKE